MSPSSEAPGFNPWLDSKNSLSSESRNAGAAKTGELAASVIESLDTGLAQMPLNLPTGARSQLLDYLVQLVRWNKSYNLTAIRDPAEMVSHHLLDALSVVPALERERAGRQIHVLDVGSGAGLPGLALLMAADGLSLTLVETSGKKAAFIRQTGIELGLNPMTVIKSRVEKLNPADLAYGQVDILICRAFRSLLEFIELTAHLIQPGTVILAMKGPAASDEMAELERARASGQFPSLTQALQFHNMTVETLAVPGLQATRKLVVLKPGPDSVAPKSTIQE